MNDGRASNILVRIISSRLYIGCLLGLLFFSSSALAGTLATPAQSFIYQSKFYDSTGNQPLLDTVDLTFDIYDPNVSCLLYEEKQTNFDLSLTNGSVSASVGSALFAALRTANDPGLSMGTIFSNLIPPPPAPPPLTNHAIPCTYLPSPGDSRVLRVTLMLHSTGTSTVLSPDLTLGSTPSSLVAQNALTFQGMVPSQFVLAMDTAAQDLGPAGIQTGALGVGTAPPASGSGNLAVAGSIQLNQTLGLGVYTNTTESTLSASLGPSNVGDTWYNSTLGQLRYWNGSSVQSVGTGSFVASGTTTVQNIVINGTCTGTGCGYQGLPPTSVDGLAGGTITSGVVVDGVFAATSGITASGGLTVSSGQTLDISGATLTGLTSSEVIGALGYSPVNKAGDSMTGLLVLSANPSSSLGAVTKQYVDTAISSINTTITGSVTSFDGRTGAITLMSSDVLTALGYTPLSQAGGTLTGLLSANGGLTIPSGASLTLSPGSVMTGGTSSSASFATLSTTGVVNVGSVTTTGGGSFGSVTTTGTETVGSLTTTGSATVGNMISNGTLTSSGTITANGGLTVPSGQTLNFTGATLVGLTSSEMTAALGYTPVNKAGDTMSGGLTAAGLLTADGGVTVASGQTLTLTGATVTGMPTVGIANGGTGLTSIGANNTILTSNGSSAVWGTILSALGYTPVSKAGDTMTGGLTVSTLTTTGDGSFGTMRSTGLATVGALTTTGSASVGTLSTTGNTYLAGNVGIGSAAPAAPLDVVGPVHTGSGTTSSSCSSYPEGSFAYDKTAHAPVYCSGAGSSSGLWVQFGGSSGGSNAICYKIITSSLSQTSPFSSSTVISFSMVGGGGGQGQSNSPSYYGSNGSTSSGSFSLPAGALITVFVGGGGGGSDSGGGGGGGGSSAVLVNGSLIAEAAGGAGNMSGASTAAGGGSTTGGVGGHSYNGSNDGSSGSLNAGGNGAGDNQDGAGGGSGYYGGGGGGSWQGSGGTGAFGGTGGTGGSNNLQQGGGGGGYGGGGGGYFSSGGSNGANGTTTNSNAGAGGLGANNWASGITALPAAAGAGGAGTLGTGGNAGLVILSYSSSTCSW